jgi:DNA polymerase V
VHHFAGKMKKIIHSEKLEIFAFDDSTKLDLPYIEKGVSAGFPSPAEDYLEQRIDLNQVLIKNPSSTFYARVRGNSMKGAGVCDGDLVIIDKSLTPHNDSLLVCFIDGEFTLKKVRKVNDDLFLIPENPDFKPIKINPESDFRLWGVVTYTIHRKY